MSLISLISKDAFPSLLNRFNENRIYLEDIKSYLDKDALRQMIPTRNLRHIKAVYVDEDAMRRDYPKEMIHHSIPYNRDYTREWGNTPIIGAVIIVVDNRALNSTQQTQEYVNTVAQYWENLIL